MVYHKHDINIELKIISLFEDFSPRRKNQYGKAFSLRFEHLFNFKTLDLFGNLFLNNFLHL